MSQISYDQHPELVSHLSQGNPHRSARRADLRNSIFLGYEFIAKYLVFLPSVDREIAMRYFLQELSQDQISFILDISQAAVSRRIKYIVERIKFLIKIPSLNPVQVRLDLQEILPEELVESAFFFYWELAQNRVKHLIDTSQSGAANKLQRILTYLEDEKKNLSEDPDQEDRLCLTLIYLAYFRHISSEPNIITFLYKKNDKHRAGSLVQARPLVE